MKTPATLYKFRSLSNFDFVADIICNNKFYAADFLEMNDPMEGQFSYHPETKKEYIEEIKMGKKKLRVCSFSSVRKQSLLGNIFPSPNFFG